MQFRGIAHKTALFFQEKQLSDSALWAKFVDLYRSQPDGENMGWRGEYWGKMMRGGALVCGYTKDAKLYEILNHSVRDMLTVAESDGRVSTYTKDTEFDGWDLWSRKYVLLGCEYYLEICKDEAFKEEIIAFLCDCTDYIMTHIGADKKPITKASRNWLGINSSSILEPVVRLYKLTGRQKYLDFAKYIIDEGGADGINIFELAYENKLYPYQYGVPKAYELTSCFEGLLEYYLVTGIEKYKIAVINFAKAMLQSDISIIGCSGITHEMLDHTRTRQTVRYDGVMQETCVTVTWMKFCSRLLELTGESLYADAMEQSFYNAYLGAVNTEDRECTYVKERFPDLAVKNTYLPVDSYSPLTWGKRGRVVGGTQLLPDLSYYGCCACIASAGVGVFLKSAVTSDETGITVNFYETGVAELDWQGSKVTLSMETDYPTDGKVKIRVQTEKPVSFTLKVRNPGWSAFPDGYTCYNRVWVDETLELNFPMPITFHHPIHWEEDVLFGNKPVQHNPEEDNYIAVTRGPLVLAADTRLGISTEDTFALTYTAEPSTDLTLGETECMLKLKFTQKEGAPVYLIDYASAGKDWQSQMAAWLPTER